MCTQSVYSLPSLRSLALGSVTEGQLGCSPRSGSAGLWGDVVSSVSTVRLVTHQQHLTLLDVMDQKLPTATGRHVLCFPVAPIADVGHQDLALESSTHPIVNASGFPPVPLNFDILD